MRKSYRLMALAACFVLAFNMTACRSSKKKSLIVKKDDPWYESVRFQLDLEHRDQDIIQNTTCDYINGKLYNMYVTYGSEDYLEQAWLAIYNGEGIREKNLLIQFPEEKNRVQGVHALLPDADGKTATVLVDMFAGGFEIDFAKVDLETGTVLEMDAVKDQNGQGLAMNYSVTSTYRVDQYLIINTISYASLTQFYSFIFDGAELLSVCDYEEIGGAITTQDFSFDKGSGKLAANAISQDNATYLCEIDPATGKITNKSQWENLDQSADLLTDFQYTKEGELMRVDSLGNVYKYDAEKKESVKVLDNSWYSPYFYDFNPDNSLEIKILTFTEDTVVFCFYENDCMPLPHYIAENYFITILKKAETNPHAGKKVLEINAPLNGSFSDYLTRAIVNFNATDDEYLIRIWSKYNEGIKPGRNFGTIDQETLKAYTLVSELQSTDCPDLVINMQQKEAMKDDILEDLNTYLDDAVKEQLFANIIDAAKVGEKLYFIPVTIEVEGLVAGEDVVGKDCIGLTFADYSDLVDEKLGGVQPYDYSDSYYNTKQCFLLSCIDIKSAIEGQSVNFDSEQFRLTAEYAKAHFVEDIDTTKSYYYDGEISKSDVRYTKMTSYGNYIIACGFGSDAYRIIGTPSVDGAGPRFKATESISVASRSENKEGCKKFLNYLYGGSFITDVSPLMGSLCINKNVINMELPKLTALNNETYDSIVNMEFYFESDMQAWGFKHATESMQENFYSMLSTLSVYYVEDKDIANILYEEIAPYYAGDRSLDDAIKYINERVATYMNETR